MRSRVDLILLLSLARIDLMLELWDVCSVGAGRRQSLVVHSISCRSRAGAPTIWTWSSTVSQNLWAHRVVLFLSAYQLSRRYDHITFFVQCSDSVFLIWWCSLLNRRDKVKVRQDHGGDEVVLAALMGLVKTARKSDSILLWLWRVWVGRVTASICNLWNACLTCTLLIQRRL